MSSDPNLRRLQIEAYEAVLKALSAVKLDWSNQKLLTDLRRQLNITQRDYVGLLDKVLKDPEVRLAKASNDHTSNFPPRYISETENETDTDRDDEYSKDDDHPDEDSYSEGSTSPQNRGHSHSGFSGRDGTAGNNVKGKRKGKKKNANGPASKRASIGQQQQQKSSISYGDSASGRGMLSYEQQNPLSHDDVQHYELSQGIPFPLSLMKPPYEKNVFAAYLLHGTIEELKEMNRHIKRKRQILINNILEEDDDNGELLEDDLVQKILLREKNVRQEKVLEAELKLMLTKDTS